MLFQSEALWDMTSPNARAWNATLNASATFGINVIPMLVMIIVVAVVIGLVATSRGF